MASKFFISYMKRMSPTAIIATHSGSFHCDEALGVALLKCLDEYKDAEVIRSRDPAELEKADIVIDVGAVFDLEKKRFDHHQRGFSEVLGVGKYTKTKLSSAGLVYKYYAKDIFRQYYKIVNEDLIDILFKNIYGNFIESIDGIDNGISVAPEGAIPAYKISTDLSSRVGRLVPSWNETDVDENSRFMKASAMCFEEFDAQVRFLINHWWPAREIVQNAFENRFEVHNSGRIIEMKSCPWKEHLDDIENDSNVVTGESDILYVLFQDQSGSWRVGTTNVKGSPFQPRKPLLERLRGLRDEELSKAASIDDLIFVHASGFIGGAKTREGALKLAELSLNHEK